MSFDLVFNFLIDKLSKEGIKFAVIGGLALQFAKVTRTTLDVDLIILAENKEKIKEIMLKYGYELLHESEDVLNFYSRKIELGRVDFLLAHRKYAKAMLERAKDEIFGKDIKIRVIQAEDQIGLKVQSSSNDPDRLHQDIADIELLLKNNYPNLDMKLIREYFRLFDREKDLDNIMKGIKNVS